MSDVVTITHCRRAGWCMRGVRTYCDHNDLDFRRLLREGLPVEDLLKAPDAHVLRAVAVAREDQSNGR